MTGTDLTRMFNGESAKAVKRAAKRKSKSKRSPSTSEVCCSCLGTGKYQHEFNAPSHWHLEKFSPTYFSIMGRVKTLSDGASREEVMGVAEYSEAMRIRDNHNGEIDELLRLVRRGAWPELIHDLKQFSGEYEAHQNLKANQ